MLLQVVWKEKDFQDDEDDEELNKDDGPQRLAECHIPEPVVVQVPNSMPKSSFFHRAKILIGNSVFFDLSRWQR